MWLFELFFPQFCKSDMLRSIGIQDNESQLYYTEPFIITLPSSGYDLNNVESDINH